MASRTRNTQGWCTAAQIPPITMMSSTMEAVQLVKGSGEVLMSSREPAFMPWVPAARVPPKRAAARLTAGFNSPTAPAANSAPAGIRIKV